jgi:hypothetical protein
MYGLEHEIQESARAGSFYLCGTLVETRIAFHTGFFTRGSIALVVYASGEPIVPFQLLYIVKRFAQFGRLIQAFVLIDIDPGPIINEESSYVVTSCCGKTTDRW